MHGISAMDCIWGLKLYSFPVLKGIIFRWISSKHIAPFFRILSIRLILKNVLKSLHQPRQSIRIEKKKCQPCTEASSIGNHWLVNRI